MITRHARAEDCAALLPLVHALAAFHSDHARADAASLFADAFGPNAVVQILVVEISGQITGYAALVPLIQLLHGARGFDLHHLFVGAKWRGQGIGKALIAAAQSHARQSGAVYLTVSTTIENTTAQAYYLAQGAAHSPVTTPRYRWVL